MASKPSALHCPRCGYDLGGVVAIFRDSCPLEGTCSECGMALRWGEVSCPAGVVDRSNFESLPDFKITALVKTSLRCMDALAETSAR